MAASEGQAKAPWFAAAIARACKSPEIRAYAEYFITAAAAYVFMTDLIKAAYVHAGDPLVFTYPRHPASAVIQPDASLIVDGTPFDTLSAAGGALRGGPTNGWACWAVAESTGNQVPITDLRARLLATKTQPGN